MPSDNNPFAAPRAKHRSAICNLMSEKTIDMRTAAYVHGLSRINQAVADKGTQEFFAPDRASR